MNKKKNRAAAYDDEKFIGESTYAKSDKVWIIDHTFVEKSYGGQGIAGRLVAKLVEEARKNDNKNYYLYVLSQKGNLS